MAEPVPDPVERLRELIKEAKAPGHWGPGMPPMVPTWELDPLLADLDELQAQIERYRETLDLIADGVPDPRTVARSALAAPTEEERRCQGCEDAPVGQHTGPHDWEAEAPTGREEG